MARHWNTRFSATLAMLALTAAMGRAQGPSGIVSDDFNAAALNGTLWSIVDPVGDAWVQLIGGGTSDAVLQIALPAGPSHDAWIDNRSIRILQPAQDVDFEVEAKFQSVLSQQYQSEGIIVQGTDGRWVRFDFYHSGSGFRGFAATFAPPQTPNVRNDVSIQGAADLYMRVQRQGSLLTQSLSYDGSSWTTLASFDYALTVTDVGVFAGNHFGTNGVSPAFDCRVDYFFNTAFAIVPEDDPSVDLAPPSLSNLQVDPAATSIRVTWDTDEPTNGRVEYGQTPSYELGSFANLTLSTHHDVNVLGLTPDNTYYLRVLSADAAGNVSDQELVVATDAASGIGAPVINVWYGDHQRFGQLGVPQPFANILGNVSDPQGVAGLTYRLNGGPAMPLSRGPDNRRLALLGDFNAELELSELNPGANQLLLTAWDAQGNAGQKEVTVEYFDGTSWPRDYTIDWSSVSQVPDVAQVVDGLWSLESDSVRPVVLDYDRLIGIGDLTWDDYEIEVPIRMHFIDPAGFEPPSTAPLVGLILRWPGHQDWDGSQPRWGFLPLGGLAMFRWNRLEIMGSAGSLIAQDNSGKTLSLEVPYILKFRVEGHTYSFKAWMQGTPEPLAWDLVADDPLGPTHGSALLVAHHVDVSFGDVTVRPGPFAPPGALEIDSIDVTPGDNWAIVSWQTNQPAQGRVDFGTTASYGQSVSASESSTSHEVVLEGLQADTSYHYRVTATEGGSLDSSEDRTFMTAAAGGAGISGLVSDDFSGCSLDSSLWQLVDPRGDSTISVDGAGTGDAHLEIRVPAGVSHNPWLVDWAPRAMQDVDDEDFQLEVKFDSALTDVYQMQGVIVEADASNWLRFDVFRDGIGPRLFASSFINAVPSVKENKSIIGGNAYYIRVEREGDQWTMTYSLDGQNWFFGTTFMHSMEVRRAGVFGANHGTTAGNAPPFTARADYVFNMGSPIVPEDDPGSMDGNLLSVEVVGDGQVDLIPDQEAYGCGDLVTVMAVGEQGATFARWELGLTGSQNPTNLVMNGDRTIRAIFDVQELPPVISDIQVVPSQTSAIISWTTDEPAAATLNYGFTAQHELNPLDVPDIAPQQSVTLTGLLAGTVYHFEIVARDASDNQGFSGDFVFQTQSPAPISDAGLVSDEFDAGPIDFGQWTFADLLGDSSAEIDSGHLLLHVPGGVSHDAWIMDKSARLLQDCLDQDFEVVVKFTSEVLRRYQSQGIGIEQDSGNRLRFDFYHNGSTMMLFAASFSGFSPNVRKNAVIASGAPTWMRVRREGDFWTLSYSYDGTNWLHGIGFSHALTVQRAGVFAGNHGTGASIPAFTAAVDYFHVGGN